MAATKPEPRRFGKSVDPRPRARTVGPSAAPGFPWRPTPARGMDATRRPSARDEVTMPARAATPPLITELAAALSRGAGPVDVVGGTGGFAGLVLAHLRQAVDRPLVVVVPDDGRASVVEDGIDFFSGGVHGDAAGDAPPRESVQVLAPLDHVPFQGMSPSRLQVMERVTTLFRAVHGLDLDVLVVPAAALIDRVIPRAALERSAFFVARGERLSINQLAGFLAATGYHRVPAVEDPGTFAVRGGIVDVFSPLDEAPVRIELWGDEVDTLKFFDPVTQRTTHTVARAAFGPARDVLFTHDAIAHAKRTITALADTRNVPTSRVAALLDDVDAGVLAVGVEDLLPLFHPALDTLFDLAWSDAVWLVEEPERCEEAIRARWADVQERAERRLATPGELALPADALFIPADEAVAALSARMSARLTPFERAEAASAGRATFRFAVDDNSDVRRDIEAAMRDGEEHVLSSLTARVHRWRHDGLAVVACAHSAGGVDRLDGLVRHYGVAVARHDEPFRLADVPRLATAKAQLHLYRGAPGQGFRATELGFVLLDETEILGKPPRKKRRRRQAPPEQALQSWRDLAIGDHVVHLQHGIGRYVGLEKTVRSGLETDFVVVEYAEGNKLYVPIEKLHLVSKHSSAGDHTVPLDKLGGAGWQRTSKRVKKAVRNIADKLLRIYAERAAREGFAFSPPDEYFHRFEAGFPYEETPDQSRAIRETLQDMQKQLPMDRLVCGDVGFGKTEVAMRAAFKAVLDGRQVAVLVPTQVLAEQHRMTFQRRFEGLPVTVDSVSGMKSTAQQKEVLDRAARGTLDIVIGTHRLLSKDVKFKSLGLLVVDEEHRFGVAHKERLKRYRATVDVLTLTATPIPRTLHLSMVGIRDITLIRTPPIDRLPIRTLVAQPNEDIIRDAIRRELARGGQVYFVHNRVEDIAKQAELIRRLVPEARIAVGHGQMAPGHLEQVMMKFVSGQANVLVSTTIIESGIDIPTANTILINRADRFGLAQLYQLRGRVGRSSERAFCYLLIPSPANLAGDAKERIAAIQRFSELGSGFAVASHDLDIRGAGDILGADQAGNIDAVGYDAYMELLRHAIDEVRAEQAGEPPPADLDPELKIAVEGRIPESWLPDTTLRLRLYRDLASANDVDGLLEALKDAVDRYGRAPEPVKNLVELMAIKLEARALGIKSVVFNPSLLSFALTELGPFDAPSVAAVMSAHDNPFRVTPDLRFVRQIGPREWTEGLDTVRQSLRWLGNFVSRKRSAEIPAAPRRLPG
ncbi:MAG: transcription-repair coupling factor [Deltaproteobacteria bacterium]|nr:MAG: transcription-repair coupling factor [Deltaproteobacteria bacterium]